MTASHATFLLATGADATLPGILRIDELAIRRAIMNVVANAIDYGWPSSTIRLEFTVSAARLAIVVDDDGPGFSPAALAHGTERFFRGDPARTQATIPAATRDLSEEGAAPAPSARVPGATGDVLGSLPTSDDPSFTACLHSGLGLAIAEEAIRAAGGTLTLANRTAPDGTIAGARVTLTLPLIQP